VAIAAATASLGWFGLAVALDPKDLPALQATVHEMCVQPDRKGDYLQLEGDLNAEATLRIVGLQASGKITQEAWNGISQRLDRYKTDPRECAISIVGLLAPLLSGPKPENANPVMEVSLDDSGISLINRGGRAFNVEEQDDARFWAECRYSFPINVLRVIVNPKRATEGVIRFWELRGLRNGLAKLVGLIGEKFPNSPKCDIFTCPVSANFRMRISVDYEGAGRTAYRQYFGISCHALGKIGLCETLELSPSEYNGFFSVHDVTIPVRYVSLSSFDDEAIKSAINSCPKPSELRLP
jgi:hypothetical protein